MLPHQALNQVRWTKPAAHSPLLATAGLEHGFCGRAGLVPAVHHLRQVHGTAILHADLACTEPNADTPADKRSAGDGIYSMRPGLAVAVKTADCVPLLLADRKARLAMAIHAGWRGLTAGIIPEGIRIFSQNGVATSDILAAIGPAIGIGAFEVGIEVVEALHASPCRLSETQAALCLTKGLGDRWHVDLKAAAAMNLLNAGLPPAHIEVMQACTVELANSWFSYRREGKGVGSNWSWIRL